MPALRVLTRIRRQLRSGFLRFLRAEAASGVLLIAASVIAIVIANSRIGGAFQALWERPFPLPLAGPAVALRPLEVINEGLMTLFFLVVGLELKRELVQGELASLRRAALPIIAALGGMAAPAGVYLLITRGTELTRGWAVPTATDIAFTLGVMTLLGRRVPLWLKVFVTALAIADDLGAVVIIGLFYSGHFSPAALLEAAGLLLILAALNRLRVQRLLPYLFIGALLFAALLHSGVHPTLAGVILGLFVPLTGATEGEGEEDSPLHRLLHALHGVVAFAILPLFALANAGVHLPLAELSALFTHRATLAVALGLLVGKPVGITLATLLALRLRIGALPSHGRLSQVLGAAMLAGIGFTMSIFTAQLAFPVGVTQSAAKLGILVGSLLSSLIGALWLGLVAPKQPSAAEEPTKRA